jgi:hypothetical protein
MANIGIKFPIGSGGGGGGGSIPQYSTDPVSPSAEDVWVLHETTGTPAELTHSLAHIGLTTGNGTLEHTYTLKYRTLEGTTASVGLNYVDGGGP